ncbi:MAG: hypothetical protein ACXAC8_04410 [Candidatus Hodarchaeales archaeon]
MQLYLGVVPGIFPWLKEPSILRKMRRKKAGIMFSYWSFRKKIPHIISKGLHEYFSYEGPIMIDSGAYSAFNSGSIIRIEEYSSFLSKISIKNSDLIVNLDVIGNPMKSRQNWEFLTKKIDINILPVIHLPEKVNLYPSAKFVGLGGMVPAFKINQKGSVQDIVSWVVSLSIVPNRKYHGFGIGSPFHQIAFQEFFYSVDWIGWRRNAAVCSCYTPEGSIYIHEAREKKKKGKSLTPDLFEKYKPPFIDSYDLLHIPGTEGWIKRALWNAWWFLSADDSVNQIICSSYVRSLKNRIKQKKLELKTKKLDKFF